MLFFHPPPLLTLALRLFLHTSTCHRVHTTVAFDPSWHTIRQGHHILSRGTPFSWLISRTDPPSRLAACGQREYPCDGSNPGRSVTIFSQSCPTHERSSRH